MSELILRSLLRRSAPYALAELDRTITKAQSVIASLDERRRAPDLSDARFDRLTKALGTACRDLDRLRRLRGELLEVRRG